LGNPFCGCAYRKIKYLTTVTKIPDDLWDEIELLLPSGKPNNTIGRPLIQFGKVLDGINSTCLSEALFESEGKY
jgi:hypothetical protein